jgi:hypothetical protein
VIPIVPARLRHCTRVDDPTVLLSQNAIVGGPVAAAARYHRIDIRADALVVELESVELDDR